MLSTTSKYAVRALVELARTAEGERVLGHDLAARAGLPANYLSKILVSLGRAGLVEATRGSAGGYRLRREPDEVTLLEVVELIEGPQRESECLLRPGHACSTTDPCTAHREWARVREHYLEYLAGTSVGALVGPPAESGPKLADSGLERRAMPEEEGD